MLQLRRSIGISGRQVTLHTLKLSETGYANPKYDPHCRFRHLSGALEPCGERENLKAREERPVSRAWVGRPLLAHLAGVPKSATARRPEPQPVTETLPVGLQVPKLALSQIFRAAHCLRRPYEAFPLARQKA